jgi:hypothetical protein
MEIIALNVLVAFIATSILLEGRKDVVPKDHLPEHSVSVNIETPQFPVVPGPGSGPGPGASSAPVGYDPRWLLFPPLTPGGRIGPR